MYTTCSPLSHYPIFNLLAMRKLLTVACLIISSLTAFAQVSYDLSLLPDNETYLVSFLPGTTYMPPSNIVVSGQVTIRLPHGVAPNVFEVVDLTMETPGATWQANDVVYGPAEAPSFDYVSFSLTTPGTIVYNFVEGVPIPVFSFKNGAAHCADSLYIIDNVNDPFLPPNSLGLNIGNSIVISGGGFSNSFGGVVGTGAAPGTPVTICTDEMLDVLASCDSVIYQGETFVQDTVFELHYTSSMGCDSVFITEIRIQDQLLETVDTTICEGDIFKGVEILQDETVTQLYTSTQGCDSTVTYLIQLAVPSASTESVTVVEGDMVAGIPVFSDTVIINTLSNAVGCDSIETINVMVVSIEETIIDANVCLGESYNGVFYLNDTTFTETLTGQLGFDSIVIYNIDVHETYFINTNAELCYGQAHSNGVVYENDTTFTESYQSIHGCDSLITTVIQVTVPEFIVTDTTVCYGEMYQGVLYEEDQVFTQTLPSQNGCDSIVNQVNLTVFPDLNVSIDGVTEICQGEETVLTASGMGQFEWSNGQSGASITVDQADTYAVTVSNSGGCSAEASVIVSTSGLDAAAAVTQPVCYFDLNGAIEIENVNGGIEPYTYSIDGGNFYVTSPVFPNLSPGTYNIRVQDAFDCYWEESIDILTPTEIFVSIGDDEEIRLGESVGLTAATNVANIDSIVWSPAATLDCSNCLQPIATPVKTTTYRIKVVDSNGCVAENSITVIVKPGREIFVPNAFSPNDDGVNDHFTVFAGDNVTAVHHFAVFERWGGQVFDAENLIPNDLSMGWNGKWRGEYMPAGTYIWVAEVEFKDGKIVLFEGSVSLLK